MNINKIQFLLSLIFILAYMGLLTMILAIEVSDSMNMIQGENSMMGELKILLGVLTGAVGQILNFWFSKSSNGSPTE